MQLFYNPDITETTEQLAFYKHESKHIVKVLRKKPGDVLLITNGKGWKFTVKIINADYKNCLVQTIDKEFIKKPNYSLHMAIAPTKMNDRFEWFLEKATEIGVDTITPILCDHSERKVIKKDRFIKIMQSAMKQSAQYYLPKLNPIIKFNDFVKQDFEGQLFIAHCEETDKKSLKAELQPNNHVTILIGPEGDFSVKEIETALQNNFIPVTLGRTRLRTETAAIVACHSVAFINE
jgi:16S rRNA (uracil1498-N3)-methyltransferase